MKFRTQSISKKTLPIVVATGVLLLVGCMSQAKKMQSASLKDGDVHVPSGYQSWQKFVKTVEKSNGQIREIYINDTGLQASEGEAFPSGTITVMEIYSSKPSPNGSALVKDKLSKVFVMEKGKGPGQAMPEDALDNGEWSYGAYLGDALTPATQDFSTCRSCHAPMAEKDYIARYDEHFTFKK